MRSREQFFAWDGGAATTGVDFFRPHLLRFPSNLYYVPGKFFFLNTVKVLCIRMRRWKIFAVNQNSHGLLIFEDLPCLSRDNDHLTLFRGCTPDILFKPYNFVIEPTYFCYWFTNIQTSVFPGRESAYCDFTATLYKNDSCKRCLIRLWHPGWAR